MNNKLTKIMSWLAAAVFLFALAVNVKVTLDDPFAFISNEAIATGSSESSGGLFWKAQVTSTPCTYKLTTTVTVEEPIGSGIFITTTEEVSYTGVVKNCIDGWNACSKDCVGATPNT